MIDLFHFMSDNPFLTILIVIFTYSLISSIINRITRIFVKHDCRCDCQSDEEELDGDEEEDHVD